MNSAQRASFLTVAIVFNTLAELLLETAEDHAVPVPPDVLDAYKQLAWAFEHDDPQNLAGMELTVFAAIRDRIT